MNKKKRTNNKNYHYNKNTSKKKILDGVDLAGSNFMPNEDAKKKLVNNQTERNVLKYKHNLEENSNQNIKNNYQKEDNFENSKHYQNKKSNKKTKDFIKEEKIINPLNKEENNNFKNNSQNYNEKIQSFISILFTIIIFIALILLIIVLYNNYLKKDEDNDLKINKEEVCQEYIKKDYGIKKEEVLNFIKLNRGVFYSLDNFNNQNLTNQDLLSFITYYIWSSDLPYNKCLEDEECLVSKKEIELVKLKKILKQYLNYEKEIKFNNNFQEDDNLRLYLKDQKVILTFKEFMFQTYRHDFIETLIDEDNIKVIMALSKKIDNTNYSYLGYKTIRLKYLDNHFVITSIETNFSK